MICQENKLKNNGIILYNVTNIQGFWQSLPAVSQFDTVCRLVLHYPYPSAGNLPRLLKKDRGFLFILTSKNGE